MTPSARVQAAIEILDDINRGVAAEAALTRWSRNSKFAGSKDRNAVRDHVFDVVRCKRSSAALGGGDSGRQMMIGFLRQGPVQWDELFGASTYGAPALSEDELALVKSEPDVGDLAKMDVPDWLVPQLEESLGSQLPEVMGLFRERAPVFLRINRAKDLNRDDVIAQLIIAGFKAAPHSLSSSALVVEGNPRGIRNHPLYLSGEVELQDAASQAVIDVLDVQPGDTVLDYCAGGGGKSLALAAMGAKVTASDIDPKRMGDIPRRAARAGTAIRVVEQPDAPAFGPYDVVLCDAPCSGTGAWRRQPDAKWRLTPDRLSELNKLQFEILRNASTMVGPDGRLAYATCSLLNCENEDIVQRFVGEVKGWSIDKTTNISPLRGGDGFFLSTLTRSAI